MDGYSYVESDQKLGQLRLQVQRTMRRAVRLQHLLERLEQISRLEQLRVQELQQLLDQLTLLALHAELRVEHVHAGWRNMTSTQPTAAAWPAILASGWQQMRVRLPASRLVPWVEALEPAQEAAQLEQLAGEVKAGGYFKDLAFAVYGEEHHCGDVYCMRDGNATLD